MATNANTNDKPTASSPTMKEFHGAPAFSPTRLGRGTVQTANNTQTSASTGQGQDITLCRLKHESWYAKNRAECNQRVHDYGNVTHAAHCVDGKSHGCDRTHTFDRFLDGARLPASNVEARDGDEQDRGLWNRVRRVFTRKAAKEKLEKVRK